MASHHHPHHHPATATTSTICYCCYYCTSYNPYHQQPTLPDPHFTCHHPPPPPQTNVYSSYPNGPNPPYTTQNLHPHPHPHHHHHQQQQQPGQYNPPPTDIQKGRYFQQLHHHQQGDLTHTHPIVSSLLRRIATLESSVHHHSSSHSHCLRDAAARTIQTHFRAFLVRRSRTLRQLKDLASIKSSLNILKSSNTHFDPQFYSHKALKLLLKLDSIQGADPMIRDGKKSISRELTRFIDLIIGVTMKKSEISARLVNKNVTKKSGGFYNDHKRGNLGCRDLGKNKRLEDLVSRIDAMYIKVPAEDADEDEEDLETPGISIIEKNAVSQHRTGHSGKRQDGVEGKVKKSVSFVENGKVYKVPRRRYEPVSTGDYDSSDESDSVGAKAEEVGEISLKEKEDDEENLSQDGESTKSGDGDGGPMYTLGSEDGSFTFSAPLPVKMETRTDMMDKRRLVKLAD